MMLRRMIVKTVTLIAALEKQNLTRTYLPHHELESVVVISIVIDAAWHAKLATKQTCVTP